MMPRFCWHIVDSTESGFCMRGIHRLGLHAGTVHKQYTVAVNTAEALMLHLFVHQADVLLLCPDEDKS